LSRVSFEKVAHAARAMSARKQHCIERRGIGVVPALRGPVIQIDGHRGVSLPRIAICPRQKPDEGQVAQQRNGAPQIQPAPGQHGKLIEIVSRQKWQDGDRVDVCLFP
jgi:hypothetical protein